MCDVEFSVNKKKDNNENQYLSLLEKIMKEGLEKNGRNGVTKSLMNNLNLSDGFPLLTTKKVYWKICVEELLFFIRGDTNTKKLEEKGIKIWKGNTSKEFLEKMKFTNYSEGEMGPILVINGDQYFNKLFLPNIQDLEIMEMNNSNCGIDQLSDLIRGIKTNPTSRRLLMTDYNPLQVKEGVCIHVIL